MNAITKEDNILFELDKENHTAEIIRSPNAIGNILLPKSVVFQQQEYQINKIRSKSFKNNEKIRSIKILKDSNLQSIQKKAFASSSISYLHISKSVESLEDGWCTDAKKLTNVTISPENPHFKYLDDEKKVIVGKSDEKEETFDTIIFACRNIEKVTIPKHIKYIKPNAFESCIQLKTVEIPSDSEIVSIGKDSFALSSIKSLFIGAKVEELEDGWCGSTDKLTNVTISPENTHFKYLDDEKKVIVGKSDEKEETFDTIIFACRNIEKVTIPKHIKYTKPNAFEDCTKLRTIEIPSDSEIVSIGKGSFASSRIKSLFIGAKVEELEDSWCDSTDRLTNVIVSPENPHFKYLDDDKKVIVGKSDEKEETFDTIIFACRNIEKVTIPKHIKYIKPNAFEDCKHLKTILFSDDSELTSIGTYGFASTGIKQISIPKSVCTIKKCAFFCCENLRKVQFQEGSKLISFTESLFDCFDLKSVEISDNSSLRKISRSAFKGIVMKSFYIPASVEELENNWCEGTFELERVKLSPKNKHFKYLDDDKKVILGKSDKTQEIFDTIVFACRDITQVTIPDYIKYIDNSAFDSCIQLGTINISENSELENIYFPDATINNLFIPSHVKELEEGWCLNLHHLSSVTVSPNNKNFKYMDDEHKIIVGKSDNTKEIYDTIVFACRDITEVTIPDHIKFIQKEAFDSCKDLETINISENSQLMNLYFPNTSIKSLFIPANVKSFQLGWCKNMSKLKNITISPENKDFKYLNKDKQVIVGKSEKEVEIFDKIVFASRNINYISIPKQIKFIQSRAFENCYNLKYVEIPDDSELKYIDTNAFYSTSISCFKFPREACKYQFYTFASCPHLFAIEFLGDALLSEKYGNIFDDCSTIILMSFPNVQRLNISKLELSDLSKPSQFKLYVSPRVKVTTRNIFITDKDEKIYSDDSSSDSLTDDIDDFDDFDDLSDDD